MGFKVPRQAFESHQGFNAGAVTPLLLMRVFHPSPAELLKSVLNKALGIPNGLWRSFERIAEMKSDYEFITDSLSEAYMDKIADDMVRLFGISPAEAVGRINRHWRGRTFTGKLDLIYHETSDNWANSIYYGHDSRWWAKPPGLAPLPFP